MWEELITKYGPWALFALLYYQERQNNKELSASLLNIAVAGTAATESFKALFNQFLQSQEKH